MFPLSFQSDRNSSIPLPLDGPFGFIQARPSEPAADDGASFADALKQAAKPAREPNDAADTKPTNKESKEESADSQAESSAAAEQAGDAQPEESVNGEEQVVTDEVIVTEEVGQAEVGIGVEEIGAAVEAEEETAEEVAVNVPVAVPVEDSTPDGDEDGEAANVEDVTIGASDQQVVTEHDEETAEVAKVSSGDETPLNPDSAVSGKVEADVTQQQADSDLQNPQEVAAAIAKRAAKSKEASEAAAETDVPEDGETTSDNSKKVAETESSVAEVAEKATAAKTGKEAADATQTGSAAAIVGGPKQVEGESADSGESSDEGSTRIRRRSSKNKSRQADDKASPAVQAANKDATLLQRVQQLLDKSVDQGAVDAEVAEGLDKLTGDSPQGRVDGAAAKVGDGVATADAANTKWSSRLFTTTTKRTDSGVPRGVDQTQILNRVAKAFDAARNRGGEVRLRLSPPELGALKLQIKVQDGVMTAKVEAETQGARRVLLDNLNTLKERLAEQGMRVEQFDVDLPDPRGDQQGRDLGEQWKQHQKQQGQRQPQPSESSSESSGNSPESSQGNGDRVIGNDQLNVTV